MRLTMLLAHAMLDAANLNGKTGESEGRDALPGATRRMGGEIPVPRAGREEDPRSRALRNEDAGRATHEWPAWAIARSDVEVVPPCPAPAHRATARRATRRSGMGKIQ